MDNFLNRFRWPIIALMMLFMTFVSLKNAANDSAIFDETAHIGAAYTYLTQYEIRLNPEHPPLLKDLAAFPLLFLDLNFDTDRPFWTGELPRKWDEGQWEAGRSLLYDSGNDPDQILFWSRFPIVLISLLLGLFIFKWAKELAGIKAGMIALLLYAFDPNILGHNHFVTTDLGIAAFLTFSLYYYLQFLRNPNRKNVLLAGLFLGLVMLTKFSFLLILPIVGLMTLAYPWLRSYSGPKRDQFIIRLRSSGLYLSKGAGVLAISLLMVWAVYFGNTFRMSKETVAASIDFNFPPAQTDNLKNVYANKSMHWLNDQALTRPLAIFEQGIAYVFRRVAGGNGAYYFGQVSSSAFPSYFPMVFLMKEPLYSLALFTLAALAWMISTSKAISEINRKSFRSLLDKSLDYLGNNIFSYPLAAFIALYAYISITGNLNIGFRHLFPILPFIYILAASSLARLLNDSGIRPWFRWTWLTSVIGLLLLLMAGTVMAYPYYMSYFNRAAGGPKLGYRYVTDSNADWGQDLERLKTFLEQHPEIKQIRVDYFGGGKTSYYLGNRYLPWWDSKRPIEAGWYAISVNFLQGSLYETSKKDSDSYRWIWKLDKRPEYQVGTSILIYHINQEELDRLLAL